MPPRHLIVGGGTAGLNAIRTIREEERMRGLDASEITLVSAERPYSRMVLPYYLWGTISESHVYTAPPASLTAWKVKALVGRKAKALDPASRTLTLDDDAKVEFDDCLIATGSRAAKAPIPGADGPGIHCFWTLDEAKDVVAGIAPGSRVVMVGAGFIAFTILNAILARGARLTIVEVAPRILPRMVDDACAGIVQRWLEDHDVAVRTGATVTKIEQVGGTRKLSFKKGAAAHRRPGDHGHRHPHQSRVAAGLGHRDGRRGPRRDHRGRPSALERQDASTRRATWRAGAT